MRYQHVSYAINSRSGDENAFRDMCSRCKAVGVNIIVDLVCEPDGRRPGEQHQLCGQELQRLELPEYSYDNFHHDCKSYCYCYSALKFIKPIVLEICSSHTTLYLPLTFAPSPLLHCVSLPLLLSGNDCVIQGSDYNGQNDRVRKCRLR